jgi:DNA-binding transcriptional ArsR family regulator
MGKKTSKAIDKLRADVQGLSEAVWALKQHVGVEVAGEQAATGSTSGKNKTLERLAEKAVDASAPGVISSFGSYVIPDGAGTLRTIQWQLEEIPAETVLPSDVEATAERISAVGHKLRLAILLQLLDQPKSASDLVTALALGTTGAAYHHLNVLQHAGFVVQQERGTYEIVPEQIAAVVGILAALTAQPSVDIIDSDEAVKPIA